MRVQQDDREENLGMGETIRQNPESTALENHKYPESLSLNLEILLEKGEYFDLSK
jgi:hypothetical protein